MGEFLIPVSRHPSSGTGDAEAPAPVVTWTAMGQSVAKPSNDYFEAGARVVWRRNEDRYRFSETRDGVLAVVSDGAGSSGLWRPSSAAPGRGR